VATTALAWPDAPSFGVFATRETLLAQGVLLVALLVSAFVPWFQARVQARRAAREAGSAAR
jgi:hypothetical protein